MDFTANSILRQFPQVLQIFFALLVRQPDNLERMIALNQAVGVVVNGLAGARK